MSLPKEILELADLFNSLPGIGPKLSQKLALYLTARNKTKAHKLSHILSSLTEKITDCSECGNVCIGQLCTICEDPVRSNTVLWVVEDPLDLFNIEQAREFTGKYHVLNGVISPVNGIGPDELNISSLIARIKDSDVKEVILGLNPNVEGESTSLYLREEIGSLNKDVKVTQLAKGIPTGSDIEFLSHQTLLESFRRREEFR